MNIFVLGTNSFTADVLRLLAGRLPIRAVIGLSSRAPTDAMSGYIFMEPIARDLGLEFISVQTYALSSAQDRATLTALPIDLLIVCGWQRLVPPWLIEHARGRVVGTHGSPTGITGGRGRSPQNWALIARERKFQISIFFIEPAIDSGPVIATRTFCYDKFDDIVSSYLKVAISVADMLIAASESGALAARSGTAQPASAFYLPQRLPEDGAIDWTRPSQNVVSFVAALTRPYPGAYSEVGGARVRVWHCRPCHIESHECRGQPGRIVLALAAGPLLIEGGDGLILVDDYSVESQTGSIELRRDDVCKSVDFATQIQRIIARHTTRYPDLPVAPLVTRLARVSRQPRGSARKKRR
jgi:methionyl-tRNA formyltransferase